MKSYKNKVIILGILYFAAVIFFAVFTGLVGEDSDREVDVIKLNGISYDAGKCWDDISELGKKDYDVNYFIFDTMGKELYSSVADDADKENVSVVNAIKKGYPYRDVTVGSRLLGYVVIVPDGMSGYDSMRLWITIGLILIGIIIIVAVIVFGVYVKRSIYTPFQNMERFAGRIAEGDLDDPLTMDKNNMFGAFTESFDIMREELKASKERETALQKREKELVASLSHDLKTPITGIKLTCELLAAKLAAADGSEDVTGKIDTIYKKADQIDALVNDLFSSALEDLGEFKVNCTDESSSILSDIIKKYDDKNYVQIGPVPEVLIHVDNKRMGQVIGNIIANSYKYAGTQIDVNYRIVDDYLEMSIADHGPGVEEDELDLITNKFYRGKRWKESKAEGSGLGLYIAKTLMEKMDGELIPESDGDGFTVILMIPLS